MLAVVLAQAAEEVEFLVACMLIPSFRHYNSMCVL